MAVLKSNVLVRTPDGQVARLDRGTDRDDVEGRAEQLGVAAQRILDEPAHWVDALDDPEQPRNLLDSETSSPVRSGGRKAADEAADEAESPRKRRPAPKGVVEA